MSPDEHDSIVARQHLSAADLSRLETLASACRQNDGVDLSLVVEMAASFNRGHELPQPLYIRWGELVGIMALQLIDQDFEASVMVHPAHRRQGIGRALLATVGSACVERGLPSVLLVSDESLSSGQAFAKAVGGRYVFSEFRMHYAGEGVREDRLVPPRRDQSEPPIELHSVTAGNFGEFARLTAAATGKNEDAVRQRFDSEIGIPNRELYIARRGLDPVGVIRTIEDGEDVYITTFGVLPEHRRRGYGRQILLRTLDALRAENWGRILIEVVTENRAALSLYRSCGFREISVYAYHHLSWSDGGT